MSAIDEYVNNPIRGERATAEELHPGTLVRYNDGSTALCEITSAHAGGWHGIQCMGGCTFIHDNGWSRSIHHATELDRRIWEECVKWRRL